MTVESNVAEPPTVIPPRGTIAQIVKWTTDLCNFEQRIRRSYFRFYYHAISKHEIKTRNNLIGKCSICLNFVTFKRGCTRWPLKDRMILNKNNFYKHIFSSFFIILFGNINWIFSFSVAHRCLLTFILNHGNENVQNILMNVFQMYLYK